MYIAENIKVATTPVMTQPRKDFIEAVTPIQFGIRSRTCEYTIVPEYRINTTNGVRNSRTRSNPKLFMNGLFLTLHTLLKTVSTRIIIQMTSQTKVKALTSPKMSLVAEERILSAELSTVSMIP